MKTMVFLNKFIKEEKGQVFLLALVMLLVGGLVLTPLLNYMGTGLISGEAYEKKTDELYAADAGIEDAIWQMNNYGAGIRFTQNLGGDDYILSGLPMYHADIADNPLPAPFDEQGWSRASYSIADVNGKSVSVEIQYLDGITFLVESTATDENGETIVAAYVSPIGYWGDLMDNAITSIADVSISPGATVSGDVQYNGNIDNKGEIIPPGVATDDPINWWPTVGELSQYYQDVLDSYSGGYDNPAVPMSGTYELQIDNDTGTIGPMYVDGTLKITGSTTEVDVDGNIIPVTLGGLIYATEGIEFKPSGLGLAIDLAYETFYTETTMFGGTHLTLRGSGCLIAGVDVDINPHMDSEPEDYILCLAITGENKFQPTSGTYYGTLAGHSIVDVQPGVDLVHTTPPRDLLNFPGAGGGPGSGVFYGVLAWEINSPQKLPEL
jgi:hypothetical protein